MVFQRPGFESRWRYMFFTSIKVPSSWRTASLNIVDKITYLGTILGDSKGQGQTTQRIQAANRAFYSLQGAGLNCCGVSPNTAIHIYSTAVRSCLTYGCSAVNISKTKIKELDKIQGKHIKCILGLKYNTRT